MRALVAVLLLAGPAWADDVETVQTCIESRLSCFGDLADICAIADGDTGLIPPKCWVRERDAWQVVLDRAYAQVLLETFEAPKSVTQTIRAGQEAWMQHRDLHCRLETMSNPRTHGSVEAGCLARMTYQRVRDVSGLIGADWAAY